MYKILKPAAAAPAYDAAASEFARYAALMTGVTPEIVTEDDGQSDLVIIGSDAVNNTLAGWMLHGRAPALGIRYNTDGYAVRSAAVDGRDLLILAGGRGRSTLYAVYRYFELLGCRWFWDGDRVPKRDALPLGGFAVREEPRFEYRGLRYFAHRSLHRTQAEHWSLDDWKREIDWMLKKRLNLFMLRIGTDDLFQKAFPDVVDYPDENGVLPEAGPGYDDRTTFWSLKYRGELRKALLAYAFERDLMHPEDCGTMTHWYSRTPVQYLEKVKPTLLSQTTGGYNQQTGLVWDILDDRNLDNYFKLTEAHIQNYGRPELFHTIGLAERRFSADKGENHRLKLYVYRRITRYLGEHYPNAPLLLASWDLWQQYTPEEVQALVAELDPRQTVLLDYTSDTSRANNFTNWGVVGKFPWIFGLFGGFEQDSDVRGNYPLIEKRLAVAKDDPFCRGMIYWPELSHSDTFQLEYLAENAWSPLKYSVSERVGRYCFDRYGDRAEEMAAVWRKFLPVVECASWCNFGDSRGELWFNLANTLRFPGDPERYRRTGDQLASLKGDMADILRSLAQVDPADDEMLTRDLYDIARTVIGHAVTQALIDLCRAFNLWMKGSALDRAAVEAKMDRTSRLLTLLGDLLASHDDYSLYATYEGLKKVAPVNAVFENTLKNNASCGYCRSYIYENVRFLYQEELGVLFGWMRRLMDEGVREPKYRADCDAALKAVVRPYYALPLSAMRPVSLRPAADVLREAAALI